MKRKFRIRLLLSILFLIYSVALWNIASRRAGQELAFTKDAARSELTGKRSSNVPGPEENNVKVAPARIRSDPAPVGQIPVPHPSPVVAVFPYFGKLRKSDTWPLIDSDGDLAEEAARNAGFDDDQIARAKKIFSAYSRKMDVVVSQNVVEDVDKDKMNDSVRNYIIKPFGEDALELTRELVNSFNDEFGEVLQTQLFGHFDTYRYSGMGHFKTTFSIKPTNFEIPDEAKDFQSGLPAYYFNYQSVNSISGSHVFGGSVSSVEDFNLRFGRIITSDQIDKREN